MKAVPKDYKERMELFERGREFLVTFTREYLSQLQLEKHTDQTMVAMKIERVVMGLVLAERKLKIGIMTAKIDDLELFEHMDRVKGER